MDLIYTDAEHRDVGVLHDYTFDLAFGSDENDFELTVDLNRHCCKPNSLVYIEGTEYGGIVDKLGVVTEGEKLYYMGRTWHGILASKIIEPDDGEAYMTVAGEANEVIRSVIGRLGLTALFSVSEEDSDIRIGKYSFDRYVNGYVGLTKMLASVSAKLKFKFASGKVVLSALPIVDYSKDEQFDNDQVEMTFEKTYNGTNHLICLGKGELAEREVVHLYMNAKREIQETRAFTGIQEIMDVYDYPNAESLDELKKKGIEKLKEYAVEDKVQLDFASEETVYDIGDIIGAKEIKTGTYASEKITKKIVTINNGLVNIQYKVGEQ